MATDTRTELGRLARRFHALADPTRLAIVQALGRGEHCVCELMDHVGAAQSRLSFHLKTLKDAGVVTDRRDGRWMYYRLDPAALHELRAFAGEAARVRNDRLCCAG